jgi:glutathione S-transferase
MLTLNVFGPYFGLPDASPFCIKALMLMKMSGLQFETKKMSFKKAPKGKAPYLQDGNDIIADSFFIERHLQTHHGINLNANHTTQELAKGCAAARMMEEHLYFLNGHQRWMNDVNFWKGPYQFFADAPAPLRPIIARIVRRNVKKTYLAQGVGRHSDSERLQLAKSDLLSIENMIAPNNYLLGDNISGFDASVFPFLLEPICQFFISPTGDYIRTRPILMNYIKRINDAYFPEFPF